MTSALEAGVCNLKCSHNADILVFFSGGQVLPEVSNSKPLTEESWNINV